MPLLRERFEKPIYLNGQMGEIAIRRSSAKPNQHHEPNTPPQSDPITVLLALLAAQDEAEAGDDNAADEANHYRDILHQYPNRDTRKTLSTVSADVQWSFWLAWEPYEGARGGRGWIDRSKVDAKGRPRIIYGGNRPGEKKEKQEEHSGKALGVIRKVFQEEDLTDEDIAILAESAGYLTHKQIREARALLGAKFGGKRGKQDRVDALRAHVQGRMKTNKQWKDAAAENKGAEQPEQPQALPPEQPMTPEATQPEPPPVEGQTEGQPERKKKKYRKSPAAVKAGASLWSQVLARGGLKPSEDMNFKEDIQEAGLLGVTRKNGRPLDELAADLAAEGHIHVPEGGDAEQILLDNLQKGVQSLLEDDSDERMAAAWAAEQEELSDGIESAQRAGVSDQEIAEALGVSQENALEEGAQEGLRELAEGDSGDAGGAAGEGDAAEAAAGAGGVDDFEFGANAKDQISGGKADDRPDSDFPADAIAAGQSVESEHTSDPDKAREIAKDHLSEDPQYYDKLTSSESKTSRHAEPLAKIAPGQSGWVAGHRVKRNPDGTYRLETDKHHVTGTADEIAARIERNWQDQKPERSAAEAALARADAHQEPDPFHPDYHKTAIANHRKRSAVPDGSRVVSLDPNTRGRTGTVAHDAAGRVVVKADGSPDVLVSDFEPLDEKHSWRSNKAEPTKGTPPVKQGNLLEGVPEPPSVPPSPNAAIREAAMAAHRGDLLTGRQKEALGPRGTEGLIWRDPATGEELVGTGEKARKAGGPAEVFTKPDGTRVALAEHELSRLEFAGRKDTEPKTEKPDPTPAVKPSPQPDSMNLLTPAGIQAAQSAEKAEIDAEIFANEQAKRTPEVVKKEVDDRRGSLTNLADSIPNLTDKQRNALKARLGKATTHAQLAQIHQDLLRQAEKGANAAKKASPDKPASATQAKPAAKSQPAAAKPQINLDDPKSLADAIAEAGTRLPHATTGNPHNPNAPSWSDHKVHIVDLYDAIKDRLGGASLNDFKAALLKANQARTLDLGRIDLPQVEDAAGKDKLLRGEINHLNAQFHVVTVPKQQPKAKPEPQPAAADKPAPTDHATRLKDSLEKSKDPKAFSEADADAEIGRLQSLSAAELRTIAKASGFAGVSNSTSKAEILRRVRDRLTAARRVQDENRV